MNFIRECKRVVGHVYDVIIILLRNFLSFSQRYIKVFEVSNFHLTTHHLIHIRPTINFV